MSKEPLRMRDLWPVAAILGLEIVIVAVAVLLFSARGGMLFEDDSGLGYYALAIMLIFIVGVNFVWPIWAVFRDWRSGHPGRASSDAPQPPSESR